MSLPIKLSNTAITMYNECPRKYRYRYIDKLVSIRKGTPLLFGVAIDEALTYLLKTRDLTGSYFRFDRHWSKQKDNSGNKVRLRGNPNMKYSKADYDEHLITSIDLIKIMKKEEAPEWFSLRRKAHLLIKGYYDQILPQIDEVLDTQLTLIMIDAQGNQLKGIIDLKARLKNGKIALLDNKTTSVKYTENSVKESFQLALYEILCQENDIHIDTLGYLILNKKVGKRLGVNTQIITDNVDEDFLDKVVDTVNNVMYDIRNEIFTPNFNSCTSYYGRCDYWLKCHENSDEGLISLKKEEKNVKT